MSWHSECIILIIDIRKNANEETKRLAQKAVEEFLKSKICEGCKDYISFVLLGSEQTRNALHDQKGGHEHITQYEKVQLATWNLLMNFFKFVNTEASAEADWVKAIKVALDMIEETKLLFKIKRQRIVLFHDFDGEDNDYNGFDGVMQQLLENEIGIFAVSRNIRYIDQGDVKPCPVFVDSEQKSKSQAKNESKALSMIPNASALLCNYQEFHNLNNRVEYKNPWAWNSFIYIGSGIKIPIQGVIALKDESKVKLKKCWASEEEHVMFETKYYANGKEIEVLEDDLIDGYMLGATPISCEPKEVPRNPPGLTLFGFVKLKYIPSEYYTGDSLYQILHKKGNTTAARKIDALVKVLLSTGTGMLCWKVYNEKYNNKRLTLLVPKPLRDNEPASLYCICLSYHDQHVYFDFPKLCSRKTECNEAQLAAVDALIDAMDLTVKTDQPRTTYKQDQLRFDCLPNIYEQNLLDILERKILCNASDDDEQFQEMLKDKNFVEQYWKVPELLEEDAKRAAQKVKRAFPLEKNFLHMGRKRVKEGSENIKVDVPGEPLIGNSENCKNGIGIIQVGDETPGKDFGNLMEQYVVHLQNATDRVVKFNFYAAQARAALWRKIFGVSKADMNIRDHYKDIIRGISDLSRYSHTYNSLDSYNKWMRLLKEAVVKQRMFKFWQDVIIEEKLGLRFVGEETIDERVEMEQFFSWEEAEGSQGSQQTVGTKESDLSEIADIDIDDLLARM